MKKCLLILLGLVVFGMMATVLRAQATPETGSLEHMIYLPLLQRMSFMGHLLYVADVEGNDEIYRLDAEGLLTTRLTFDEAVDTQPAFSPDGTKIAFSTNRDGQFEIYVMDADGNNPTRLTNDPAMDTHPAWSPDGEQLAFISDRDGNADIYTVHADGTNLFRLTNTPDLAEGDPSWSPAGDRIAFGLFSQNFEESGIYAIQLDGSNQQRLSPVPLRILFFSAPDWSPDGTQLVYKESDVGHAACIRMIFADGSGETGPDNWCYYIVNLYRPIWEPTGHYIAFSLLTNSSGSFSYEIVVRTLDGVQQSLTNTGLVDEMLFDWVP